MTLHQNRIAGEWVGTDGAENINPWFGSREQVKYAAEFFTVVKTAYTLA